MNLLDLPDEILFQICNQLSKQDLNPLIEAYPEFASKIEKFYRFYSNKVSAPIHYKPVTKLCQHIQTHKLSELVELFDSQDTSDLDHVWLICLELVGYNLDIDPAHFLKMVQRFPNAITILDHEIMSFPIPAYYEREHSKMTKVLNHLFENLDSTKTKSICFPFVKSLHFNEARSINYNIGKFQFPRVSGFDFYNFRDVSSFKAISNLELPLLHTMRITDDSQTISNKKSILHALKFDKYKGLGDIDLRIHDREENNDEIGSILDCDMDGVVFDMGFLGHLRVSKVCDRSTSSNKSMGVLRNLNVLHNVQMLTLSEFCSVVNFNAPNLKYLVFMFSNHDMYLNSVNEIKFKDFNAPNLLKLSIRNATDSAKKWIICADRFENINAPNLKSVDVYEKSLQSNKSLYFDNLEEIYIDSYSCWEGKFNCSKLLKLSMILDLNKDISLENPDPLTNTAFSSLKELVFPSTHDRSRFISDNVPPFDILKFPFIKTYPTLTRLNIENPLYNSQELPIDKFLSRFPNLKILDMAIKDESIKIDGLHMDNLDFLTILLHQDVQQFEMINCQFQKLGMLKIYRKHDPYADNQFNGVYGKLDNIITPGLKVFETCLSMACLDLKTFQSKGIEYVTSKGQVFQIDLGDVSSLKELIIKNPFSKLDYTNVPSYVYNVVLKEPFPTISKNNIARLYYLYKQNKHEDYSYI